MGISPRQIGWSNESNLLWQISKQMDNLTNVTSTSLSTIIADLATKVTNQQGVPSFRADTLANLPVAGQTGRMFVATDTYAFYRDNGLGWDLIGGPGIGTVTGSGTATQVAFWNGTSVISGSNNLFWDNANSRLGIGTSSPTALLDVRGTGVSTDFRLSRNIDPNIYLSINAPGNTPNRSTFGINGTNVMTLNASGNVGIGTTTPQSRIHALLSGSAAAGPTGTVAVFQNSTPASNSYITLLGAFDSESGIVFTDESVAFRGKIGYNNSTEFMYFQTDGSERMRITSVGNVGIGTSSPQTQLDIANGLMFGTIDAFPSATYDAAAVIAKTGSLGSAPFNNAGSIVYRARVTSTAGRSSHIFYTGSPSTERMRLDESGNLGLGVTPSAWGATWRALELEYSSAGTAIASLYPAIMANTYNTGGGFFYKVTGQASYYQQIIGQHRWHTAPSGTSGNAISFTQVMTLDASGRLGIGSTSPENKLTLIQNTTGATENTYAIAIQSVNTNAYTELLLGASDAVDAGIIQTAAKNTNFTAKNLALQPQGGKVGIGLTNPAQRFVVRGQNGNSALEFDNKASNTEIVSYDRVASAYRDLYLHTSSASPTMVLNTSGNVGVGIVPTAYLGFVSSAAGISLHTNSTSGAAGLNFYENGSGRFSLRTLNGTAGLSFFDSFNGAERARIDASGNLGLGVTPSAWTTNYRAVQIGTAGISMLGGTSGINSFGQFGQNYYYDGINYRYLTSATANFINMSNGVIAFFNAPSGTAGNVISFTQAMTLDASGRLGISTTSPTSRLTVKGENTNTLTVSGTTVERVANLIPSNDVGNLIFGFNTTSADSYIQSIFSGGALIFGTRVAPDNFERMRITSGGELLINTTSDAGDYKLQVNGNVYSSSEIHSMGGTTGAQIKLSGSTNYGIIKDVNSVNRIWFENTGSYRTILDLPASGTKFDFRNSAGTSLLQVFSGGSIQTAAPSGGTAKPFKIGAAAVVTPTSPNRTIEIEIDGTTYYLTAKTTND